MKKYLVGILAIFLFGCAITTAKVPVKMSDGATAVASVSSFRVFQQVELSYSPTVGLSYGSNPQLAQSLQALAGIAEIAGKMYGQSQGIPIPSSTASAAENNSKQISVEPLTK